jgi:DNA-binding beta-propeller fold protein YncE
MPTDYSQVEDRLRAAYSDVAETVGPDDISAHAPPATSPVRLRAAARTRRRRGPALAAAAGVVLIVTTATVIPHVLQSGSRSGPGAAGDVPHSHMAYVVSTSQSNSQSDALVPVNLLTGRTLKPIPLRVKGYGSAVAISPTGKWAYVLTARSQLVPVNLATGRAGPPIEFGGVSQDLLITPDGNGAYILQPPYGVEAVGLTTRTALGFIKVHDAEHYLLTPDGKTLYVLSYPLSYSRSRTSGPSLTAIDTTTNTTIATIELHGLRSLGALPGSLAMAPDGKTVYTTFELSARGNFRSPASMRSTDEIIPVDVAGNTQRRPIVSGPAPGVLWYGQGLTISPDSQTGYLHQTLSVIPVDLRTGAVRPSIRLPAAYTASLYDSLTFSPDSQRLYMIGGLDPTVIPVDAATGKMMQAIQLGSPHWNTWKGVFAPGGKTLYILSYEFDFRHGRYVAARMTPVDTATGTVGKPIELPAGQDAIVFSP